ncbi:MAG TPA: pilus assembly protein TadG-related protein [Acidimicrobiia bacterium]|nr:pilus assembly protein TadG-related protein [Acidimicrobiia bacterium]
MSEIKDTEMEMNKPGETKETGAALPFVAMLMVVLLGVAAFAIDLGWLYLNGARLQRAADSSALAGVVYLPADIPNVIDKAIDGASANGWDVGTVNGTPIAGGGPDDLEWQQLDDNRLEVTLSTTIPTFFLRVLGFDTFDITRVATAEYVKPVPMGSPSACFGVGGFAASSLPSNLSHCSAYAMNFWAAINGPHTAKEHGDPFAVECITANSSGCTGGGPNTDDYRPNGYYYGIEVPSGKSSFTVRIFDAAFYDRPNFQTETGDGDGLGNSANGGMTTQYFLYAPDATPQNPQDNSVLLCSSPSYNAEYQNGTSLTTKNRWRDLCTINNPAADAIYVLRVQSTGSTGGNNSYSIGVATSPDSAPRARVYAINDMSIFTNANAGTAVVYLAEVDAIHAGKILELSFYDPGENLQPGADAWVEVKTPSGTTPQCSWVSRNDSGTQTGSGSGNCRIKSTTNAVPAFNAQWLTATIEIPDDYTCSSDCFWKMHLDMAGSQDRTTWTARVIGNPVRLVPNQ